MERDQEEKDGKWLEKSNNCVDVFNIKLPMFFQSSFIYRTGFFIESRPLPNGSALDQAVQ